MSNTLNELSQRLSEAVTQALDCNAVHDAVEDLRKADMEISALSLELTIQHMRYKFPLPVIASINWLEHLHKLEDRRRA